MLLLVGGTSSLSPCGNCHMSEFKSNIKETRKGELSTSYKIVSKVERNKKK